jgi:hypothetical protein
MDDGLSFDWFDDIVESVPESTETISNSFSSMFDSFTETVQSGGEALASFVSNPFQSYDIESGGDFTGNGVTQVDNSPVSASSSGGLMDWIKSDEGKKTIASAALTYYNDQEKRAAEKRAEKRALKLQKENARLNRRPVKLFG